MTQIITDEMLGKLTRYLRMMGHDVVYAGDKDIEDLHEYARLENRVVITRDKSLQGSEDVVVVSGTDITKVLSEISREGINICLNQPSRCSKCNGELKRDDSAQEKPDNVEKSWRCIECNQVYWHGSHWDKVSSIIEEAMEINR